MPSHCTNIAAVSARFVQAQREFFFAWKEVGASAVHERRARLHTAYTALHELDAVHERISRTIHAMWNPREIVSIEKKRYGIEARQVIEMDPNRPEAWVTDPYRMAVLQNGDIACGNRYGDVHVYHRATDGTFRLANAWRAYDGASKMEDGVTVIIGRQDGVVLTGHVSGKVRFWDPMKRSEPMYPYGAVWEVNARDRVVDMVVDPHGDLIVTDRDDHTRVFNTSTGWYYGRRIDAGDSSLRELQYANYGQTLVATDNSRLDVSVWNRTPDIVPPRHTEKLRTMPVVQKIQTLHDGSIVVVSNDVIQRWQKDESGVWREHLLISRYGDIQDIHMLPDDRILVATARSVYLFEIVHDHVYALQNEFPLEGVPIFVRAQSDGTIIAADNFGKIYIFDGEPV